MNSRGLPNPETMLNEWLRRSLRRPSSGVRDCCRRRQRWRRISKISVEAKPNMAMSTPCLHLGPEPVDDALGGRIARGDHEQFCQRGFVRINVLVVENFRVDEFLTSQVAVGVR